MIIIDSNIFIFGETDSAVEHDLAVQKAKEAYGSDRIGTNVIVLSEVFHHSRRINGAESAASRVNDILNDPAVDFLGFEPETVKRASKLARDFQMRINDALIAQQAMEAGASILTDNVKDFGKIKAIKVIPLRGG